MTEPEAVPIEDASVPWPSGKRPHIAVARVKVAPQPACDDARRQSLDEAMAFSPWHGIEAHRPFGSVMRTRKPAYEMSSQFRAVANKCPMHEPRGAADLSG